MTPPESDSLRLRTNKASVKGEKKGRERGIHREEEKKREKGLKEGRRNEYEKKISKSRNESRGMGQRFERNHNSGASLRAGFSWERKVKGRGEKEEERRR